MSKTYFAKYLPVKGELKKGNKVVTITGFIKDYDDLVALEAPTKVKLFICSRDIQVGDNVIDIDEPDYVFEVLKQISKKGFDGAQADYFSFLPFYKGVAESICYTDALPDPIKVIREILTPNIKEGQEFTGNEKDFLTI